MVFAWLIYLNFNIQGNDEIISVVPERKMIVVLPFENLGLPEDEYFAQGNEGRDFKQTGIVR